MAPEEHDDEMRVDPARASQLISSLGRIRSAVAAASGGRTVRLVAVSKLKPASDILALVEQQQQGQGQEQGGNGGNGGGEPQLHFGENYVQELQHKAGLLPRSIRWHFIGGLQSNKCKGLAQGVPNLWCVASVDSAKKADGLEKGRKALLDGGDGVDANGLPEDDADRRLRVYVQVNTSGEESKSGTEPGAETLALCRHVRDACPSLRLAGLMTIGAIARSKQAASGDGENEDFVALRRERDEVAAALGVPTSDLELSMGMSADFEQAIRQGSDEVRVGSDIFGARPPKESSHGTRRDD